MPSPRDTRDRFRRAMKEIDTPTWSEARAVYRWARWGTPLILRCTFHNNSGSGFWSGPDLSQPDFLAIGVHFR